jgi:hypothetical protein
MAINKRPYQEKPEPDTSLDPVGEQRADGQVGMQMNPEKKLARPHLNQQTGRGGMYLPATWEIYIGGPQHRPIWAKMVDLFDKPLKQKGMET